MQQTLKSLIFMALCAVMAEAKDPVKIATINQWLTPTLLSGLFITFFILSFLFGGMMMLGAVQTQSFFVVEGIDHGKIEKS